MAIGILNGNFRGGLYYQRSQQIEADAKREALHKSAEAMHKQTMDVCQEIVDSLHDQIEYRAWWEQTPEGNKEFFNAACEKLLAVKGLL